jgi:hypothetical protein
VSTINLPIVVKNAKGLVFVNMVGTEYIVQIVAGVRCANTADNAVSVESVEEKLFVNMRGDEITARSVADSQFWPTRCI